MTKTKSTSHYAITVLEDVLAVASTLLKRRKDRGVEKLHSMTDATRDYVASMSDLRAKAGAAAEGIDELADYAMHTDIEHVMADAATFARKHPLATLGLTLAAGLLATQFFRSLPAETPAKLPSRAAKKKAKVTAKPRRKVNGTAHAHA
jgi:hypothetical protein